MDLESAVIGLLDSGDYDKAIASISSIDDTKNQELKCFLLAKFAFMNKAYERARCLLDIALDINPENYKALNLLGEVYLELKEISNAFKYFYKSLMVQPNFLKNILNLAYAYMAKSENVIAENFFRVAFDIDSENSHANFGLAFFLYQKNNQELDDQLVEYLLKAKGLGDGRGHFVNSTLGKFYYNQKNFIKAKKYFENCIKHKVTVSDCLYLSESYFHLGMIEKVLDVLESALKIEPQSKHLHDNYLMCLHYSKDLTHKQNLIAAQSFYDNCMKSLVDEQYYPTNYVPTGLGSRTKLRLGFVSGDLNYHAMFFWIQGFLEELFASSEVEIFCYMNNFEDRYSEILKQNTDAWFNVKQLNDKDLAKKIYQDKIDILFDLSGHTAFNRLGAFALKPAPLQINWLGQSGPLGVPQIDYMISDKYLMKSSETHFYKEKILFMPNFYALYSPIYNAFEAEFKPAFIENGYITFGSFNNFAKVDKNVLTAWQNILLQIPNSKLFIKNHAVDSEEFRKYFLNIMELGGIDSSRIIFEKSSSKLSFLQSMRKIDIALDTFPFNGATTTMDLLSMSVPIISVEGDKMPNRSTASILKNLDLENLLAVNRNEYVDKAIKLADDKELLIEYHQSLAGNFLSSTLCDKELFVNDFLNALNNIV